MKIGVVILISVVSVIFLAGLVHYGWTHRWGGEMDTTVEKPLVLSMSRLDAELTLAEDDFAGGLWNSLTAAKVVLRPQITQAPRSMDSVQQMDVRSFHNGKEAYFLLEWKDRTASRIHDTGKFPDAVAVGFSLSKDPPNSSIMMGFRSPMNFWQWKANLDAEFWGMAGIESTESPNRYYTYATKADLPDAKVTPTSACQDLVALRPGTVTVKQSNLVSGRGFWKDGTWRVIIKRRLSTADSEQDAQLLPEKMHLVFAVWDGDKGDRGSRKVMSEWLILEIEAQAREAVAGATGARGYPLGVGSAISTAIAGSVVMAAEQDMEAKEPAAQPRVINITAKRFEYNPSTITVQKGEMITLRMESLDVTHGLYLDGYGIDIKARPGMVGKATFLADKGGRFTFRCSQTCGEFHPYMVGYMTVEPNRRYQVFTVLALGLGLVIAGAIVLKSRSKGATSND